MSGLHTMNFDGLVGPTHNYAGLSHGNVASEANAFATSRPREAVLQGLEKMALVESLGVPQGLLPPLPRPRLDVLRQLGFSGADGEVIDAASRDAPALLHACFSASSMWTANAATVTASVDSQDGKVHLTPANLSSKFHRHLEVEDTAHALRAIFPGDAFVHHAALPAPLGDEGAANHTRLGDDGSGIDLFVWGRSIGGRHQNAPTRFPARQVREASEAIARRHGCKRPVFVQQAAQAIDTGAFHNDVVSVGERGLLLVHEGAFEHGPDALKELQAAAKEAALPLHIEVVRQNELSLADAVACYLFNSQIVRTDKGLVLIAPKECEENERAAQLVQRWVDLDLLAEAHFLDLRQSMRNGGGPACLRLRMPLTTDEYDQVNQGVVFGARLHGQLKTWAEQHYREELEPKDLRDPLLAQECFAALDALTGLLNLGSDFYAFQR